MGTVSVASDAGCSAAGLSGLSPRSSFAGPPRSPARLLTVQIADDKTLPWQLHSNISESLDPDGPVQRGVPSFFQSLADPTISPLAARRA